MHAVKAQAVRLRIISVCVHVIRAPPVIRYLAAFQSPTVALIHSVRPVPFAKRASAATSAHRTVTVSPINCACRASVSQRATITRPVPTSSSAKTIFVRKRSDAVAMKIACSTNTVSLTRTVGLNVKMHAKVGICAAEMPSARLVIIMPNVRVKPDLSRTAKEFVSASSVNRMANVRRIGIVTKISVNWHAKVDVRAARKRFVRSKIIDRFAIVSRAITVTPHNSAMPSTIAAIHRVDRAPFVRTARAHSIVLAMLVLWAMHTMKDADWHSNVN